MKKALFILCVMAILCGMVHSEGKMLITATGNLLMPADGNYRDLYGDSVFFPEFKLGYRLFNNGYIWLGFGFFSRSAETAILKLPADSKQTLFSFGGGYTFNISEKVGFNGELGLASISYKEEALDLEMSGSAIGFVVNGSVFFKVTEKIFLQAVLGYAYASDEIDDAKIKLGGFKSGIGVGITL